LEATERKGSPGIIRVLKSAWDVWLRFAKVLGTVQMMIILSIIYWTIFALIAIPFKLASDPLSMKSHGGSRWTRKGAHHLGITEMQSQG
jgi:hypothetical protein